MLSEKEQLLKQKHDQPLKVEWYKLALWLMIAAVVAMATYLLGE